MAEESAQHATSMTWYSLRTINSRSSIYPVLMISMIAGCYESHFPDVPVVPDPLVLVGARVEAGEIVVERNDDGVVSEVVHIPGANADRAQLDVSPDGRWAVVRAGFDGDFYLVSFPEHRYERLDWPDRGICADPASGYVEWFGAESFEIRCPFEGEWERYVGTLDGTVRRIPLAPGCHIQPESGFATWSPRYGILLARCPDGDFLIRPTGEVTLSLGTLPRTVSLNVVGPNRLGGYVTESRGSRYHTWDVDGVSAGALVPLGGGLFPAPYTFWHGQLSSTLSGDTQILFDPRSGEEQARVEACSDGRFPFSTHPSSRHLLLSCSDELRYLDLRTGSEHVFSKAPTSYLLRFSRDGTRVLFRQYEPVSRFMVYDLMAEEWSEPWPDERVSQQWLLGDWRF